MADSNANHSIECVVSNCKYHCNTADYCSLDRITVGCHEKHPTQPECTDCQSFEMK